MSSCQTQLLFLLAPPCLFSCIIASQWQRLHCCIINVQCGCLLPFQTQSSPYISLLLKISCFIKASDCLVTDFCSFIAIGCYHILWNVSEAERVNQCNFCSLNFPCLFSWYLVWLEDGSWAHLAPQCYTLSVPRPLSSELCRKISRHVRAELCRFSASYFHSAGRHRDCPPVVIKIRSVHGEMLMDSESHTLHAIDVVLCLARSSWQDKSRYSSWSDLESFCSHAEERQHTLTAWSSLVQEIVGDGIPKASQPSVSGCFKVTVRFSGWPSSWISGGTKEQRHFHQSKFRHYLFLFFFKEGDNEVDSLSPFTFSLVFLSTEPASLVATHLKSPLWLADTVLITREPSLVTDKSGWSEWISRPFLNQRTFGGGEPGSKAKL